MTPRSSLPTSPPGRTAGATDPRFATTLAHGLAVLEAFAQGPAGLTNKLLAERTQLSASTVSRLTSTLASRGMMSFEPASRWHRLASTTLTLGYPLLARLDVRRIARLPMKQLASVLGGSVSLGLRDRTRMVYVETSCGNEPVAFRPDVGAVLPMLQTAMGRAWLASASAEEQGAVLRALRRESASAYRRWAGTVAAAQESLQAHGFCVSAGDWQADVHAVAVPLQGVFGGERLVVNCGVAARRLQGDELTARVGPQLVRLARQIAHDWGRQQALGPSAAAPPAPQGRAPAPSRPSGQAADREFAQTLAHGIDLLLCFSPGDETLGNRELARRLGVSPSTVVRLTHTLQQLGYLRRDEASARYRLGAAALSVAYPMLAKLRLRELARPAMQALAQRIGGAVSLGLRHHTTMVYVETAWRSDGRVVPPDTGALMPMLASAMGRAWLCQASAAERREMLNRIRVQQPAESARFEGVIDTALAEYRRHGWCSSRDFRPEIQAFAVPFAQPVDGNRFVMNCGVLASTPLSAAASQALGSALLQLVRDVETELR